jgi:hypothetical protein
MTDEQPPASPPQFPPPPDSGPFAFPPPPEPGQPSHNSSVRGFYPLDFDGITRNAWSIFRFAWKTFIGAALIPTLIVYAVAVPVQFAIWPELSQWAAAYQAAIELGVAPTLPPIAPSTIALLLLVSLLATLGGVVASAAVVSIGDSVFRGRPATVRGALATGVRRLPGLIGAGLLFGLAVFGVALLGFTFGALFVVGGGVAAFLGLVVIVAAVVAVFFIAIRWSLLIQTIVLEKAGPVEGLSRSWRLVAGSGWRVLGYFLFVALVTGVIGAMIGVLPEAILRVSSASATGAALGTLFQGLLTVLVAPIVLVTLFLYYDLRFKQGEPAPQPGEDRREA